MDDLELLIGIGLGLFIGAIFMALVFSSDNLDGVNVRSLGEQMCAEHGLEYSHREIENAVPVIYCSDPTEEIEDGYLKKTSGANIKWRE